jgi:hypothetical protein
MQEPQAPPPNRDASAPPSEQIKPAGLFSDLKYTDVPAPAVPQAPLAADRKRSKLLSHVVLPLVILIVGVGAIAWVVQYNPGGKQPDVVRPGEKLKLFPTDKVLYLWPLTDAERQESEKEKDPAKRRPAVYFAEYETNVADKHDDGFCDYEFTNKTSRALELGLVSMFCQCSRVEVALVSDSDLAAYRAGRARVLVPHGSNYGKDVESFTWTELKSATGGTPPAVVVEPGQSGVVRLHWTGREKDKATPLNLWARLWVHPKGAPQDKVVQELHVTVQLVHPVRFLPRELPLTAFNAGSGASQEYTLVCWSATRDNFKVEGVSEDCAGAAVQPLTDAECRDLEKTLRNPPHSVITRVRSAYRLTVKLYERKDGKQLDLGAFERPLPVVFLDGNDKLKWRPQAQMVVLPMLRGQVNGEIKVNGSGTNLKVTLRSDNPKTTAKVWTRKDVVLENRATVEVSGTALADINVTVEKARDAAEEGGVVWDVTVTVGQYAVPGPLGGEMDNAVIVLRRQGQSQTIRIPVSGHVSHHR